MFMSYKSVLLGTFVLGMIGCQASIPKSGAYLTSDVGYKKPIPLEGKTISEKPLRVHIGKIDIVVVGNQRVTFKLDTDENSTGSKKLPFNEEDIRTFVKSELPVACNRTGELVYTDDLNAEYTVNVTLNNLGWDSIMEKSTWDSFTRMFTGSDDPSETLDKVKSRIENTASWIYGDINVDIIDRKGDHQSGGARGVFSREAGVVKASYVASPIAPGLPDSPKVEVLHEIEVKALDNQYIKDAVRHALHGAILEVFKKTNPNLEPTGL
jgi:hypothetical protein